MAKTTLAAICKGAIATTYCGCTIRVTGDVKLLTRAVEVVTHCEDHNQYLVDEIVHATLDGCWGAPLFYDPLVNELEEAFGA